eukprot:SAG11_NODE_2016_length_3919_cov_4.215445_3_plen_61_part_00
MLSRLVTQPDVSAYSCVQRVRTQSSCARCVGSAAQRLSLWVDSLALAYQGRCFGLSGRGE